MPTKRIVAGGVLVLTVVAGCGSNTTTPGPEISNAGAKAKPPATAYDAQIFLCTGKISGGSTCNTQATATQTQQLAQALRADDDTTSVRFLSGDETQQLAARVQPTLVPSGGASATPAVGKPLTEFLVGLTKQSDFNDFAATYAALPGVANVNRCGTVLGCKVSELRAAGVLK